MGFSKLLGQLLEFEMVFSGVGNYVAEGDRISFLSSVFIYLGLMLTKCKRKRIRVRPRFSLIAAKRNRRRLICVRVFY